MNTYNDLASFAQYNSDTINKLIEIDSQIKEEEQKEESDKDKLTKLRFAQLMKGLELSYDIF